MRTIVSAPSCASVGNWSRVPAVLVAVVLAALMMGGGPASAGSRTVVTGVNTSAHVRFLSEVGGALTSTEVLANDYVRTEAGGAVEVSNILVEVLSLDSGRPGRYFGYARLAPEAFVATDLRSAALNAVVNVCAPPGGDCFDIAISLTWSGTGDVRANAGESKSWAGGCRSHHTFSSLTRSAVVGGSALGGAATEYAPRPSAYGGLQQVRYRDTISGDCP